MKYIISRYNHDMLPILKYAKDRVIYDRSEEPMEESIKVPNIGTDIYDKFTYIVDNYDNLPELMCFTKANIFKYISEEEFKKIKDNKTFTPILTQNHKTYGDICYYKDGMYYEKNDYWYLLEHPTKNYTTTDELKKLFNMDEKQYNAFAPGSNYIVPKKNVLKHPKEFYEKLRSYLEWGVYPGEAQIIERNLYYIWS